MAAQAPRQRLTIAIAPVVGALIGLVVALTILLMPTGSLEDSIIESGLPAILPAAEPPLGATARLGLMLVAGGTVALLGWFMMFLVAGSRTVSLGRGEDAAASDVPVLRRADAHPDAPARRPLFASEDLGPPFLDIRAAAVAESDSHDAPMPELEPEPEPEPRDIPEDLNVPLSAYDPEAFLGATEPAADEDIRDDFPAEEPVRSHVAPASPVPPLSDALPLPRLNGFAPGERIETFDLTPMVRPAAEQPEPTVRRAAEGKVPDTEATVAALLERLERGMADRDPAKAPPKPAMLDPANEAGSLAHALGELRQLATRAG